RIGPAWGALIPEVARAVAQADNVLESVAKTALDEAALAGAAGTDGVIEAAATLVTCGAAPGYREATFTIDVRLPGADTTHRLCLSIGAKDSEQIATHILHVHRAAWDRGTPIDAQPGEQRPRWMD